MAWEDGEHITSAAVSAEFETYLGLGWTAIVRQSTSQALAAVDRITKTFYLSGLVDDAQQAEVRVIDN